MTSDKEAGAKLLRPRLKHTLPRVYPISSGKPEDGTKGASEASSTVTNCLQI